MSGGPGSPIGAPLQAAGKGISAASKAMDEQRRQQIAQMASQRILLQPTDAAGRKMYKEAMALRSANPGLVGAAPGTTFQLSLPASQGFSLPQDSIASELANVANRIGGTSFGQRAATPGGQFAYTVPASTQPQVQRPTAPLNPAQLLALTNARRDSMQRTPAQVRLAELLGR